MSRLLLICALLLAPAATLLGQPQPKPPVGALENPKQVTSADLGPAIDPTAFAKTKFNSLPLFRTFRSLVSTCYAIADTWVYAAGDEDALYDTEVSYPYPDFYKPTWGEVFDNVARQMRCTWSWNPKNRQFKFERSDAEPPFGVTLAPEWRREDRGGYVWHAPKDKTFGLDIYDLGHYTPPKDDPDFAKKVREHVAMRIIRNFPNAPKPDAMQTVKLAGTDALHITLDTPRPGGVWRQWALLVDDHAYLIVSAMPKFEAPDLLPAIEKMVASFKPSKAEQAKPAAR